MAERDRELASAGVCVEPTVVRHLMGITPMWAM